MKKTLIVSIIIWALLILLLSNIAFNHIAKAAEPQPATLTINSVNAYQGSIDNNDQMYIVAFNIETTSANYTGTELFLFRFYNNGVEIATTVPYSYYNEGRSVGTVGFYFSANDADLPTWGSDNITIYLVGNPVIGWQGDVPTTSYSAVEWFTSSSLLAAEVRRLAQLLEDEWSIDLIEPVSGINKLTSYGEAYFESSIPNLRQAAPILFVAVSSTPSFPTENHSASYRDTVMDRWLTTGNGTFDVTAAAAIVDISRNWLMSGLWIVASLSVLGLMTYATSEVKGSGIVSRESLRPALFLFGFLLIAGSFMGFMVLEAGLFCGIAGGLALVFAFFWKGAP